MSTRLSPSQYNPKMEMKRPDLDLRYVFDEKPPVVELHMHTFYEFFYFCEGDLETYVVGSRSYKLKHGDILIIPPGVMHHPIFSDTAGQYKRYVLSISQEFMEKRVLEDPDLLHAIQLCRKINEFLIRCSSPAHAERLEHCLLSMWYEIQQENLCVSASLHSLCTHFLVELNRTVSDSSIVSARMGYQRPLLEKIIAYIWENFSHRISLDQTAECFFVSPATVENLFRQKLGKSFYQYVIEYRIAIAQSMIAQGYPMKDISIRCGFADYSAFYKLFKKQLGVSPSEYRTIAPTSYLND